MPDSSMAAKRIIPPDEPSRDIANATAEIQQKISKFSQTKWKMSCSYLAKKQKARRSIKGKTSWTFAHYVITKVKNSGLHFSCNFCVIYTII